MSAARLLIVATTLSLLFLYARSAPSSGPAPSSKVRQTRGFRNSALATARGFGKRTFPALHSAVADGSAISTSWLAEQMSKNPEIAQLVVERFVDTDGDGQVTMDELSRDL